MSIINDALKKAEQKRRAGDASSLSPLPSPLAQGPRTDPQPAKIIALIVLTAIILICLMLSAKTLHLIFVKGVGFAPMDRTVQTPPDRPLSPLLATTVPPPAPSATPAQQTPAPAAPPAPSLTLDGVLFDEQDPERSYALINGRIVQSGEKIDNAVLMHIDQREVILQDDTGKHIRLTVK